MVTDQYSHRSTRDVLKCARSPKREQRELTKKRRVVTEGGGSSGSVGNTLLGSTSEAGLGRWQV